MIVLCQNHVTSLAQSRDVLEWLFPGNICERFEGIRALRKT